MGNGNYVAIIGPPRSGTTWMFRFLRQHPGVFVPYIKEINWFNIAMGIANDNQISNVQQQYEMIRDRRASQGLDLGEQGQQRKERAEMKTDADFRAFFEKRAPNDMPYFDISPGYAGLDVQGFQRMASAFSNAKVVLLLRNKPDRAWSVVHHVKKRRFPEADLQFVINYLTSAEDGPMTKLLCDIYATVLEALAPSNIHCLYTEELFDPATQQQVLDDLCRFVGARPHLLGEFEYSKNRGTYDEMPFSFRKQATLRGAKDYAWAQDIMGYLPPIWERDRDRYIID